MTSEYCSKCPSKKYAMGMCRKHWKETRRPGPSISKEVKQACSEGVNRSCYDCGAEPMFGGLRCLPCFQDRAYQRQERQAA